MPLTESWDIELHREIIETLNKLEDSIDAEDPADIPETPSGQPYCGCADCSIREILTIAMPRIVEAYQQGLIPEKALTETVTPRTQEEKRVFEADWDRRVEEGWERNGKPPPSPGQRGAAWRPSIVGSRTPEFDV